MASNSFLRTVAKFKGELVKCKKCQKPLEEHFLVCPKCGALICKECIEEIAYAHCPSCFGLVTKAKFIQSDRFSVLHDIKQKLEKINFYQGICPLHEKKLEFYCKTCQTQICGGCIVKKLHFPPKHVITSNEIKINEEFDEIKKKLISFKEERERYNSSYLPILKYYSEKDLPLKEKSKKYLDKISEKFDIFSKDEVANIVEEIDIKILNEEKKEEIKRKLDVFSNFSLPPEIELSDWCTVQENGREDSTHCGCFPVKEKENKKEYLSGCVTEDNRLAVSSGKRIEIYNLSTMKCTINFKAHKDTVTHISLFEKIYLISSSADTTIKIWELKANKCKLTKKLTAHKGTVFKAFQATNSKIVSLSSDKTIKIWSARYDLLETISNNIEMNVIIEMKSSRVLVTGSKEEKELNFWSLDSSLKKRFINRYLKNTYVICEFDNTKILVGDSEGTINAITITSLDNIFIEFSLSIPLMKRPLSVLNLKNSEILFGCNGSLFFYNAELNEHFCEPVKGNTNGEQINDLILANNQLFILSENLPIQSVIMTHFFEKEFPGA